jgi:putative transposase
MIDGYSRKVLAWRRSNTLNTRFCLEALKEALAHNGAPELFNPD